MNVITSLSAFLAQIAARLPSPAHLTAFNAAVAGAANVLKLPVKTAGIAHTLEEAAHVLDAIKDVGVVAAPIATAINPAVGAVVDVAALAVALLDEIANREAKSYAAAQVPAAIPAVVPVAPVPVVMSVPVVAAPVAPAAK